MRISSNSEETHISLRGKQWRNRCVNNRSMSESIATRRPGKKPRCGPPCGGGPRVPPGSWKKVWGSRSVPKGRQTYSRRRPWNLNRRKRRNWGSTASVKKASVMSTLVIQHSGVIREIIFSSDDILNLIFWMWWLNDFKFNMSLGNPFFLNLINTLLMYSPVSCLAGTIARFWIRSSISCSAAMVSSLENFNSPLCCTCRTSEEMLMWHPRIIWIMVGFWVILNHSVRK